jgi:hypothetical protein
VQVLDALHNPTGQGPAQTKKSICTKSCICSGAIVVAPSGRRRTDSWLKSLFLTFGIENDSRLLYDYGQNLKENP